jgi:hypothetical protein
MTETQSNHQDILREWQPTKNRFAHLPNLSAHTQVLLAQFEQLLCQGNADAVDGMKILSQLFDQAGKPLTACEAIFEESISFQWSQVQSHPDFKSVVSHVLSHSIMFSSIQIRK